MTRPHVLIAAAVLMAPLPALASITVLGSSAARSCYNAAETKLTPRLADFRVCDTALRDSATPHEDIVATHVNRGILYLRRGDVDAAMRDFDRAMQLDPDEPEAYLNRGSALLKREQTQNAVGMFNQALEKNTTRPELAYYARGVAHELLGNLRGAYQDYTRASQLAPQWEEPRMELARFRVTRN